MFCHLMDILNYTVSDFYCNNTYKYDILSETMVRLSLLLFY